MRVDSFYLSLLNHNEVHRLCTEVLAVIDEFFAGHTFLADVRQQLATNSDNLRRALDRDKGNQLTEEIRAADEARDDAFRALRTGVQFAQQHFNEDIRDAGQLLNSLLETHGREMLNVGYGAQTTLADTLLAALAEPQHAPAAIRAGLDEFVERFQQKQTAFKELVRRRQDADANSDVPLLKETRAILHERLLLAQTVIDFLADTRPDAAEPAVRSLNERIGDITAPAKARRTREENVAAAAEETMDETEVTAAV